MFAAQWLIDIISGWIDYPQLSHPEIINLESIICNMSKNREFASSDQYLDLIKKWLLSDHSFQPFTLQGKFTHLQRWWYFEKYVKLFVDGRLDFSAHQEEILKFLTWADQWSPENRKELGINLFNLRKKLPQYDYLWDTIKLDQPGSTTKF